MDARRIARAAESAKNGDLVVYPTETVYGLGADALSETAVERVFEVKGRPRDDPVSFGVASVERAAEYTRPTEREVEFMEAFLPGPVTVVVEAGGAVPEALTAGRDRVGIRIPDHPVARDLLREAGPLTATSANRSGTGSARTVDEIDGSVRTACGAVLDVGELPGTESTVVDVSAGTIHRRGALADRIATWIERD
ncbi:L-threonylcarbamoyladenylate synthase [Halococcus hamelinensis]|uniref:L-threonylcarbamoyladenylate synthase n=1 Tax=Halococcus hamelinensis 100A6 TaxID=1132509 RepID=M0LSR5_9EURY|nr:L-threonylcarbamoyladenylate synthase [Halococcus hamelinensis]EMA36203.1 Sua5/YciO/YrdC/YwlC family protein [Halococcus hamelinensis 100A6]